MLTFHVLSVGHGDSIVIEHRDGSEHSFAVIDSNQVGPGDPPALRKLRELGAQRLRFVALTHPHYDHYRGLYRILEEFRGRVDLLYTFPLRGHLERRIKQFASIYAKVLGKTDSTSIARGVEELVSILHEGKKSIGLQNWMEPSGEDNSLFPSGFANVAISTVLPPARVRGPIFEMLAKGDTRIAENRVAENNLSLAFLFKYSGVNVLLGGDGTYENWCNHWRSFTRASKKVSATAVKLPHHGAKEDCRNPVLPHLFMEDGERIALVSANGQSHPHPETYAWLAANRIQPYCTNLARDCGATLKHPSPPANLDPALSRFISIAAVEASQGIQQACQGDISISISPDGKVTVSPQYNHPCPYRGGYAFLH